MQATTVTLDVRDDIRGGRDPFTRILQTVAALQVEESFLLIAPFKPVPLLQVMTDKGFTHDAQPMGDGGDWQVIFTKTTAPPAPASAPLAATGQEDVASGAACLEVDTRGLEPPQPLVRILEALSGLPADAQLRARTDRQPMHLYAQLQYRGFIGTSEEQNDGSYVTFIRRA